MNVRSAEPRDFEAVTRLLEELGRATVTDETRDRCREIYASQVSDPTADHPRREHRRAHEHRELADRERHQARAADRRQRDRSDAERPGQPGAAGDRACDAHLALP